MHSSPLAPAVDEAQHHERAPQLLALGVPEAEVARGAAVLERRRDRGGREHEAAQAGANELEATEAEQRNAADGCRPARRVCVRLGIGSFRVGGAGGMKFKTSVPTCI